MRGGESSSDDSSSTRIVAPAGRDGAGAGGTGLEAGATGTEGQDSGLGGTVGSGAEISAGSETGSGIGSWRDGGGSVWDSIPGKNESWRFTGRGALGGSAVGGSGGVALEEVIRRGSIRQAREKPEKLGRPYNLILFPGLPRILFPEMRAGCKLTLLRGAPAPRRQNSHILWQHRHQL